MPRTRRGDALVLRRVAFLNRERLDPVLPIPVGQQDGNRRTDRLAMTNATENVRRIALDAHPSATAVALLTPPKFTIHEFDINRKPGGHARQKRHQRLSV